MCCRRHRPCPASVQHPATNASLRLVFPRARRAAGTALNNPPGIPLRRHPAKDRWLVMDIGDSLRAFSRYAPVHAIRKKRTVNRYPSWLNFARPMHGLPPGSLRCPDAHRGAPNTTGSPPRTPEPSEHLRHRQTPPAFPGAASATRFVHSSHSGSGSMLRSSTRLTAGQHNGFGPDYAYSLWSEYRPASLGSTPFQTNRRSFRQTPAYRTPATVNAIQGA